MHNKSNIYLTVRNSAVLYRRKKPVTYKKITRWYSMADNYNKLLIEHLPLVEKYTRKILRSMNAEYSEADVDDIQQDVFYKILTKGIEQFRGDSKFTSYIFMITRNAVIDYVKKRDRVSLVDTDDETVQGNMSMKVSDFTDLFINEVEMEEVIQLVNHEVGSMKEDYRLIFKMYFVDQETQKDIACMMNKSQSTISEHVENIRRRLRQALESRFPEMKKGIH